MNGREAVISILSEIGVKASKRIHCLEDAESMARRRLPKLIYDFISGGAGSEIAATGNCQSFESIKLQPRVLRNVSVRTLSTEFLGKTYQYPFGLAPMGMCNLAHPKSDKIMASSARRVDIPVCLSTAASTSIEDMATMAGDNAWFQLYVSGDPEDAFTLVDRARDVGYDTLVFTVDAPELARRVRDAKNGFQVPFRIGPRQAWDFALHPQWVFSMLRHGVPKLANFQSLSGKSKFDRNQSRAAADWDFLARLRDYWPGNLIVKGVTSTTDAIHIKSAGVDAIYVSNHGGRQLDSVPAAIDILPAIREAVGPDYPLCFDSGIRSGEAIVKAIARGANFVMLGRPVLFALAAEGERGFASMLDIFAQDISMTLAQIGICDINSVDRNVLAEHQMLTGMKAPSSLSVVEQFSHNISEA